MVHDSKRKQSYLVALLSLVLAIVLALVYVQWVPDADNRWGQLLVQAIPSALVALIAFPVVYAFLISRGIQLLSSSGADPEEVARLVASELAASGALAGREPGYVNPLSEPMRKIDSELPKVIGTPPALVSFSVSPPGNSAPTRDALVVVDIQNDFFEGGSLPVERASSLIEPLNKAIARAEQAGALIVITQDWHPEDHRSFKGHGGVWPTHCVKGRRGAQLHPQLLLPESYETIRFGTDPALEGYSPFENPEMPRLVADPSIREVFVVGIAAEYCVLATCKTAKDLGKSVAVVEPLVRAAEPDKIDSTWRSYDEYRILRVQDLPWEK